MMIGYSAIVLTVFMWIFGQVQMTEYHGRVAVVCQAPASSVVKPSGFPEILGSDSIPVYGYEVINDFPHDSNAFTQGLIFENGALYESTGRHGYSSLRKVDLETGNILKIHELEYIYFGEGMTIYNDTIVQLTWLNNIGFVYIEQDTFELIDSFNYPTAGWGLTHDDTCLIMSDGSSRLHYLDPQTYEEVGYIDVTAEGVPVENLNELEYIQGMIYSNIWFSDLIAIIEPQTGEVVGWLNLSGILSSGGVGEGRDVLNGIAYDSSNVRLFVTGKLWPTLFEIEVDPLNYPVKIISSSPASPCYIDVDSVLFLCIRAEDPDPEDSLVFIWSVNSVVDTSAHDTTYYYASSVPTTDTVMVKVDDGMFCDSTSWIIFVSPGNVEEENSPLTNTISYLKSYPNPFRRKTNIKYVLPGIGKEGIQSAVISVKIYDLSGSVVRILVREEKQSGRYSIAFDAGKLESGIYFVELIMGTHREIEKLILIR